MYVCNVGFVFLFLYIEFGIYYVRSHCRNCNLLGGADGVQVRVCKFHLPGMHIIDELVFVHKIDSNVIVIELGDDSNWVHKFSSLHPEVHLVNSHRVHRIPRCSYAALSIGNLPWFLLSESRVERWAVYTGDGCSDVK